MVVNIIGFNYTVCTLNKWKCNTFDFAPNFHDFTSGAFSMYTKGLKKKGPKKVWLGLPTIKGQSKMCSFITQHDATDTQVLRERAGISGISTRAVAHELNVHFSTINHLQRLFREFGSTFKRASQSWRTCNRPSLRTTFGIFASEIVWHRNSRCNKNKNVVFIV